jgi:hypothetical protein
MTSINEGHTVKESSGSGTEHKRRVGEDPDELAIPHIQDKGTASHMALKIDSRSP